MKLGAILDGGALTVPSGWLIIEVRVDGVCAERRDLRVVMSIAVEEDGHRWIHCSCSRPTRIPSWSDLREVKDIWLGDRESYVVFPPSNRYVNRNPNVLHLWSRVDAPEGVLPPFESIASDGRLTI